MSGQNAVKTVNSTADGSAAAKSNCLLRQSTLGPHLCVQGEATASRVERNALSLVPEVIRRVHRRRRGTSGWRSCWGTHRQESEGAIVILSSQKVRGSPRR